MKYSVSQYAQGLYEVLEQTSLERRPHILKNFVLQLRKNKAYKLLPLILAKYEKIFLAHQHIRKVDVVSASPLPKTVHQDIESAIGKKILLTEKTDSKLIAGLTILIDDSLYIDASARTKISQLFS